MNDVIGIINDTKGERELKELIKGRSLASIPFGGRYRMVDFTLSNLINSGIENVGILVRSNYRSLMGHLRSPKEWNLDRKKDGLFILPPGNDRELHDVIRGDLEVLYSNLDYIERSKQKDVLVSGVKMISNINYRKALEFHRKKGNDITIIYKEVNGGIERFYPCTTITTDIDSRVIDMEVNPLTTESNKVCMEMYIMSKTLLSEITHDCITRGKYDFLRDGIVSNIENLKIYAFPHEGYVANINSVDNYFRHSMDLLNQRIWRELFFKNGYIYTKAGDQAPAKYLSNADVSNSLVANGCIVDGLVEDSILFRRVKVKKGASIKNCIILQNCVIGEGVELENAIIDKDCIVSPCRVLKGSKDYPVVIEKKKII